MPEHVQILARVELDGRPVGCSHAVLITQEQAPAGWEVVLLGTSAVDSELLEPDCPATRELTLATPQGELFASSGCVATLAEGSFLRLKGSAPLRRLVA